MEVRAVEAYNKRDGTNGKVAHKKGIGVGYVINIEGISIYHAGDTDFIREMEDLGSNDVALLPIGGRGFTMDVAEAVQAALMMQPTIVIPMHHFDADPQEFKNQVDNCSVIKVQVLDIGEIYHFE